MFSLVYGFYKYATTKPEFRILILGVDGAGKTSLLEQIKHLSQTGQITKLHQNMKPTIGLNNFPRRRYSSPICFARVEDPGSRLIFWDLGGQSGLRSLQWPKYFSETNLLMYVVDAGSSQEKLQEAKNAFDQIVQANELLAVPIILLINKIDSNQARSAKEIQEIFFDLKKNESQNISECKIQTKNININHPKNTKNNHAHNQSENDNNNNNTSNENNNKNNNENDNETENDNHKKNNNNNNENKNNNDENNNNNNENNNNDDDNNNYPHQNNDNTQTGPSLTSQSAHDVPNTQDQLSPSSSQSKNLNKIHSQTKNQSDPSHKLKEDQNGPLASTENEEENSKKTKQDLQNNFKNETKGGTSHSQRTIHAFPISSLTGQGVSHLFQNIQRILKLP